MIYNKFLLFVVLVIYVQYDCSVSHDHVGVGGTAVCGRSRDALLPLTVQVLH